MKKQSSTSLFVIISVLLLFFLGCLSTTAAFAEKRLLELKDGNIHLKLESDVTGQGTGLKFEIRSPNVAVIDVFNLENPNRIVVDLKKIKFKRNHTMPIKGDPVIKALRTGKHPDKSRVVLDVASNELPEYSWSESSKQFTLLIRTLSDKRVASDRPAESTSEIKETVTEPIQDVIPREPDFVVNVAKKKVESVKIIQGTRLEQPKVEKPLKTEVAVPKEDKIAQPATIVKENVKENKVDANLKAPVIEPVNSVTEDSTEEQVAAAGKLKDVPAIADKASEYPKKIVRPAVEQPEESRAANKAQPPKHRTIISTPAEARSHRLEGGELIFEGEGPQTLEDIKFYYQKPNNVPLLRIVLAKRPKFTLVKKGEKLYHLTIPNCAIKWSHLELPQFPPHDFKGFSLVMAEMLGKNMTLSIGVERGARVTAFGKNNEIWIKAVKDTPRS